MLKFSEDKQTLRIEYFVDGWVSASEYREAMRYLKARMSEEKQKFSVLEIIESFYGMPPHLLIDDLVFRLFHAKAFKKVAVVTDIIWIQFIVKLAGLIAPNKLQHFSKNQKETAIHWLEN